jgi:putative tryptophan/tyrosine transport system substrate-binding protein
MKTVTKYLIFIILFVESVAVHATTDNVDILLINSNNRIQKYLKSQQSYEKKLSHVNIHSINLASFDGSLSYLVKNLQPKLIYSIGSSAYLSALKHSTFQPIVFSSIINWRRILLTERTAGVSAELLPGAQLLLFRYFFPDIKRIGVLYSNKYKKWHELALQSSDEMGFTLLTKKINNKKEVKKKLTALVQKVDALWLIADPLVLSSLKNMQTFFNVAASHNKPVLAYDPAFIKMGAVLSVSVDPFTSGRQAAVLTQDILSQNPPDNILNPAGSLITLNMKQLHALNLMLNENALDSVNKVVE